MYQIANTISPPSHIPTQYFKFISSLIYMHTLTYKHAHSHTLHKHRIPTSTQDSTSQYKYSQKFSFFAQDISLSHVIIINNNPQK